MKQLQNRQQNTHSEQGAISFEGALTMGVILLIALASLSEAGSHVRSSLGSTAAIMSQNSNEDSITMTGGGFNSDDNRIDREELPGVPHNLILP